MNRKVSLKDIAREVGVSTALVSYVLNNLKEGRISKEVAHSIREAARRLNYRPNQIARSLKTSKTNTLGLIVADISNPFSSSLARIIEDESYTFDYTVIFGSSDENVEKFIRLANTLLNRQVEGLILSPPAGSAPFLESLEQQGIPFVLVDRYFPDLNTNFVLTDNYEAMKLGTSHFFKQGRTHPALITYHSDLVHLQERELGFVEVLSNHGVQDPSRLIKRVNIGNDPGEIADALNSLVEGDPAPDGLFFASNMIAAQCLKLLNYSRLKVPQDLLVVCFDEVEALDLFYGPISYVRQPLHEMGKLATKILVEQSSTASEKIQIKLQAELVHKGSHLSK